MSKQHPQSAAVPPYATALSLLAYCMSSIFQTLVNKFVVSSFSLHPVFLVLAVQALTSIVFMWTLGYFRLVKYRRLNSADVRLWFPVSLCLASMLYTGGKSLQYLSVPLFTIFKNLTIILVAYGEALLFRSKVTALMVFSFMLMVLSSVVGGWTDISFHLRGYMWMASNCLTSALFVLQMRRSIKLVNFQDFDTVYVNNTLTMPMYIVMSFFTEDWPAFYEHYADPANSAEAWTLARCMILSGFSAFGIGLASAWCIRVTSSTTYSMAGALNKLPIAVAGMVFFGDVATIGTVSSIILGFSAGLLYTWAKILLNQDKDRLLPMAVLKV